MLTETFFRYFQTLWPWSWMLTSPWSWKVVVVEAVVGLFCTTLLSFASSSDWSSSAEKPECLLLRTLYNNLQQNRGCWNPHYCWSVKLPEAKTLFVGNFPLKKVGGVTNLTLYKCSVPKFCVTWKVMGLHRVELSSHKNEFFCEKSSQRSNCEWRGIEEVPLARILGNNCNCSSFDCSWWRSKIWWKSSISQMTGQHLIILS